MAHKKANQNQPIPVVDLFAGPGGLAEGFASLRHLGRRAFHVAISVEKEASAHKTLQLRSFVRQFEEPPQEYYDYMEAKASLEFASDNKERKLQQAKVKELHAKMIAEHLSAWELAQDEARQLELGTAKAVKELDPRLKLIKKAAKRNAVLLGGPPCQAYSLVGRARNRGVEGYDARKDKRHFLYEEYIRILKVLRPAVFVMENVKGILSSKVDNDPIFEKILDDLRTAGGKRNLYTLFPIFPGDRLGENRFVVRSEKHGIPQRRHRVIILGVRNDHVKRLKKAERLELALKSKPPVSVHEAIGDMPRLRSGLSQGLDNAAHWKRAAVNALKFAASAVPSEIAAVAKVLKDAAEEMGLREPPSRTSGQYRRLPNHVARSHMESDLARYAFAAAFAQIHRRSPSAQEFPPALAPNHENWTSGKFADRFRVQCWNEPSTTITSHISKDGHYYIHPDVSQCRSLTVREAARLQTFPDNYFFEGNRSQQYVQVGNAVPPLLARQIAEVVHRLLT